MADNHQGAAAHEDHGHDEMFYVKIWGVLCVLLMISVAGPELGIQVVTLITAFGIAAIKAGMVIHYFMHLTNQPRFVHYFLITSVVFMVLFFAGVSPDVMNHEGSNWKNVAAEAEIERALAEHAAGGDHGHGGSHDEAPAAHH